MDRLWAAGCWSSPRQQPAEFQPAAGVIMARILIADDQEMMRDSLATTLVREGHEVVAAGDGPAALQRLASPGRIDLLITDLRMPKMTGIELLQEARKIRPDLPVI